jgi:hypothetical protein
MKALIGAAVVVVLMIGVSSVYAVSAKHEKPISKGIIVANFAVPKDGINLIYKYKDETSGTVGEERRNLTADSPQMDWLGFSFEVDNGFYPGDKVTVSVSKYVTDPNHLDTFGQPKVIPQPILDQKRITLGETGGIVSLWIDRSQFVP